jgi:phosphohistidine phosphatase SixA
MIVAHSSVVREVGHLLMGDQKKVLVEPGGVIAVYLSNGQLEAKPILKPLVVKSEADTIS